MEGSLVLRLKLDSNLLDLLCQQTKIARGEFDEPRCDRATVMNVGVI